MIYQKLSHGNILPLTQENFNAELNRDFKENGRAIYYKNSDNTILTIIPSAGTVIYTERPDYSPTPFNL